MFEHTLKNAYIWEYIPPLVLQQVFDFTTSDLHWFTNTQDPNNQYWLTINTTWHYCTWNVTGSGWIWKTINASRYWWRIKFQHVNQIYGGVMVWAWAYPVTSDANCMYNYANMSQIWISVNNSNVAEWSYTFSLNTYYYLDCKFDNGLYTLILSDSNLTELRTLTYQNSDTKWKYAWFGWWWWRNSTSCFRIHEYREAYDNN